MSPDRGNLNALRHALGSFATGVTVVTTLAEGGGPRGFTANSFTSVSLDPPLLLFCLAREAGTFPVFERARHFAINILAADQRDLSVTFATGALDKFDGVGWRGAATGSPVLDGVVGWFDCELHQKVDAGDHAVFLGRIVDFASVQAMPLGYFRGAYVPFGLGEELVRATTADTDLRVGAVIERDGAILFERSTSNQNVSVPIATRLGSAAGRDGLIGHLAECGLTDPALFLFSVYDDGERHYVIYRGSGNSGDTVELDAAGAGFEFIAFDRIPWERIASAAMRKMLRRYIRERAADAFGVYVGGPEAGIVTPTV